MKGKIESLLTDNAFYEVCKKGETLPNNDYAPECSIKHIGRQIYLVGYFDDLNGGLAWQQNRINKYKLIFPAVICEINYKTKHHERQNI